MGSTSKIENRTPWYRRARRARSFGEAGEGGSGRDQEVGEIAHEIRYQPKNELVADALRDAIRKGEIRPGERLRMEEWSRKLAVSTTPLREAFKALEAEGYIEIVPHKGAVVVPFTQWD